METFYFTFGIGHALNDRFQPIVAPDIERAREKMYKTFGYDWAFVYTQNEFQESINKGFFLKLKPLKPIYVKGVS